MHYKTTHYISSIGNSAFENCTGFTSISLHSRTTLGASVFTGASVSPYTIGTTLSGPFTYDYGNGIVTITGLVGGNPSTSTWFPTIDPRVSVIGVNAFNGYTNLIGPLNIPSNISSIGDNAFQNCRKLTSISIYPRTTLGTNVFFGMFVSPYTIGTTIPGPFTYDYAYGVVTVTGLVTGRTEYTTFPTIDPRASVIKQDAFKEYTVLRGPLNIPSSISKIGIGAFYGCYGLTGLTLSSTMTVIEDNTFSNCTGFTGPLVIPSNITEIYSGGFLGCSGFTSLTMNFGLIHIRRFAFQGCSGFTGSLVIPSSVISIEGYAFYNCVEFTGSLVIPSSVTVIAEYAFRFCRRFTSISYKSETIVASNAFADCTVTPTTY